MYTSNLLMKNLHYFNLGAGDGNRTHTLTLEGSRTTTILRPHVTATEDEERYRTTIILILLSLANAKEKISKTDLTLILVPPPGIEPGFPPSQGGVLSIERRGH